LACAGEKTDDDRANISELTTALAKATADLASATATANAKDIEANTLKTKLTAAESKLACAGEKTDDDRETIEQLTEVLDMTVDDLVSLTATANTKDIEANNFKTLLAATEAKLICANVKATESAKYTTFLLANLATATADVESATATAKAKDIEANRLKTLLVEAEERLKCCDEKVHK
ncbi:MAG: hypothetical protein ACRCZ9_08065, partial [Fusobacteriaceae bacterium]